MSYNILHARRDSNPQSLEPESNALSIKPRAHEPLLPERNTLGLINKRANIGEKVLRIA